MFISEGVFASAYDRGIGHPECFMGWVVRIQFSWAATTPCSRTPPAFTITNIPKGTTYLVFKLTDHDAPNFVHGGGQIPYSGSGNVPAGAFGGSYTGPCPPQGVVHTYQWTVEAMDASNKVLAEGSATGRFPVK